MASKKYWQEEIERIEAEARRRMRENRLQNFDYSVTLPKSLRERVAKIIPYEFLEDDENVFINEFLQAKSADATQIANENEETDDERPKDTQKDDENFNESTCSEIEMMEAEYVDCLLKWEKPVEHKDTRKKEINWISNYICQPRKERVKWQTKVYDLKNQQKTLDEQAQELMDASAERFTLWINSLGSNPNEYMKKETLMALFNIEGDKTLFASIQNDPKEVKAIAKTVADKWNLPEMAIELKYERYIAERLKYVPKKVNLVAFGRCIPHNQRPWIPGERDKNVTTVYPQEILSGEKLFKGIGNLRSTKTMVEFYRHHPQLKKPQYMIRRGYFKKKDSAVQSAEKPFYERLKLKY